MIDPMILAKIRKCLALAKSSNEHEAAAAIAKARTIMADHGIDDAMLAMADIEEHSSKGQRAQRPPQWEMILVSTVQRAVNVISFIDKNGDWRFIGRGANAEIAAYAFAVLFRQIKRARKDYSDTKLKRCKTARKRQRADVFCEAWATSVFRKVKALVPEQDEDPGFANYLAIQYPGLVSVGARGAKISGRAADDDWWHGRQSGGNAEINQGVGANSAPVMISHG